MTLSTYSKVSFDPIFSEKVGKAYSTILFFDKEGNEVSLPKPGQEYHTIKAKTHSEAIAKSPFFVGQSAKVESIQAIANNDGTWMVTAKYKLTEEKP